jgi:hypothetical protein
MKTKSAYRAACFSSRLLIGFALCSVSLLLALAGSANTSLGMDSHNVAGQTHSSGARSPAIPKLTYKVIEAPKHTHGYDVFADGRLMIHQNSVPALPGNEGFRTKEDATKVALLVIEKIRKGEMPPTISIDEMKKLKVIK